MEVYLFIGRIFMGYRGVCKEKSKNFFNLIEVKYLNYWYVFFLIGLRFFNRNIYFNKFKICEISVDFKLLDC